MASALQAQSSEPKCSICKSERRAEADEWIARRGETDDAHGRITYAVLVDRILPLLGVKTSVSSVKRHVARGHSVKAEAEAESVAPAWEDDESLQALIEEVGEMAAQPRVSPAALLNLQQRLYLLDLRRRLARGESVAVTADAAARAAGQLQKSERDAATDEFLGVLGSAIGAVFSRPGAIRDAEPAGELIEGVAVEDAELVEGGRGRGR